MSNYQVFSFCSIIDHHHWGVVFFSPPSSHCVLCSGMVSFGNCKVCHLVLALSVVTFVGWGLASQGLTLPIWKMKLELDSWIGTASSFQFAWYPRDKEPQLFFPTCPSASMPSPDLLTHPQAVSGGIPQEGITAQPWAGGVGGMYSFSRFKRCKL